MDVYPSWWLVWFITSSLYHLQVCWGRGWKTKCVPSPPPFSSSPSPPRCKSHRWSTSLWSRGPLPLVQILTSQQTLKMTRSKIWKRSVGISLISCGLAERGKVELSHLCDFNFPSQPVTVDIEWGEDNESNVTPAGGELYLTTYLSETRLGLLCRHFSYSTFPSTRWETPGHHNICTDLKTCTSLWNIHILAS